MANHIVLQELNQKHQTEIVEFGQGVDLIHHEFFLVGDPLVMHEPPEVGIRKEGLFQIGEEAFDEI